MQADERAREGSGSPRPRLSVVLAMRDPWPAGRAALDALHPQIVETGAQLVVGLGDPRARPPDADLRFRDVEWAEAPGASVFRLRALGLERARGEIVAFTEDHAVVGPGWCKATLAAHAEHPAALAIGGVVTNLATASSLDWATFLIANGRYMPPARQEPGVSLQANVSYKLDLLRAILVPSPLGLMHHTLHEDLRRAGAEMRSDERLVVAHDQSLGLRRHSAGHFHNARSIAAFRRVRGSAGETAVRALATPALPALMLWRTVRAAYGRCRTATVARALPALVWFLACHAAGELAGYVGGPGASLERVN